jgi:hypothetical protein
MASNFPIKTHAQHSVLGCSFAFSILAITAVFLRLLAHKIARKKWTLSDYLIIIACVRQTTLHHPQLINRLSGPVRHSLSASNALVSLAFSEQASVTTTSMSSWQTLDGAQSP